MTIEFSFKVHIDHHLRVEGVADLVKSINRLGDCVMSVATDLEALRVSLDTATTLCGTELAFLQSLVKNSMTDAEVATAKAGIQAVIDRLTVMGTDPNNPIPPTALAKFVRKP